jgi:hypothetical protein
MHISGTPLIPLRLSLELSRVFSLVLSLTVGGAAVQAQELSLFEPVESTGQPAPVDGAQSQPQRNLPATPVFTLVGTSRFGDRHRVTLATGNGETVQVALTPGQPQAIPDHPGYRVLLDGPRRVSVSASTGMACIPDPARGIACGADGTVQLTLRAAAPVVLAQGVADQAEQSRGEAGADEVPDNPFAAALRAAAQNEANGQRGARTAERFQARRIAPEDVPPGMRVVRTPFGDRLVEL